MRACSLENSKHVYDTRKPAVSAKANSEKSNIIEPVIQVRCYRATAAGSKFPAQCPSRNISYTEQKIQSQSPSTLRSPRPPTYPFASLLGHTGVIASWTVLVAVRVNAVVALNHRRPERVAVTSRGSAHGSQSGRGRRRDGGSGGLDGLADVSSSTSGSVSGE